MTEHIKFAERLHIEDLDREGVDVVFGLVQVDRDKCTGCRMCVKVCPAGALEVAEKKSRMVQVFPMCMSCGDCTAICPEDAISISRFIEFHKYFRYLDRGAPEGPRKF